MAKLFNEVRPGDLITANLMNQIVKQVEALDDRIAVLETTGIGDGAVAITGLVPTGTVRVGDILQVDGRHFNVPAEHNEVSVGGVRIQIFRFGSSDEKLIFDVPAVPGLQPEGSTVQVVVRNPRGTASAPLRVQPALQIPHGRIEVLYVTPPVMPFGEQNILRGKTYTFTIAVTAFVDRDATYKLTPEISGNGNWTAQLPEGNLLNIPGVISGIRRDVPVRVTVPDGQPNGTIGTLRLAVTENTPGSRVPPGEDRIEITIGSPPPTPETRVRVTLQDAGGAAEIVGDAVQFPPNGATGLVRFIALFTEGGHYSVTTSLTNPTGWTPVEISIEDFDVIAPAAGATTQQNVNVSYSAGTDAADTDLLFTVTGGSNISVQYALRLTVG